MQEAVTVLRSEVASFDRKVRGAVGLSIGLYGCHAVAKALAEVRSSGSSTLRAVNYVLKRMTREQLEQNTQSPPVVTRFGDLYVKPHSQTTYDDALGVNHDNT